MVHTIHPPPSAVNAPWLQVGYGDIVAQTAVENWVVIMVEVIGVLFFGLLISSIR